SAIGMPDEFDEAEQAGQEESASIRLTVAQRNLSREKNRARRLQEEVDHLRATLGIREAIQGIVLDPPKWQIRQHRKGRGKYHAIAQLNFSDWHFDEVVDASLMNYVNAYNRRIGEQRLKRW